MGNHNVKMTYSFEIDNFSKRSTPFNTPLFSKESGSCNWFVTVYPATDKTLSLFLAVPHPHSRPRGWSRETSFRFVVVNPSNALRSKSLKSCSRRVFNKDNHSRGLFTYLSLDKLQKKKFLLNDKLKIEVYIDTTYVRGELDPHVLPKKIDETVSVNGFQVLDSQVKSANWIFETYPETALYIHPQDPELKTAYMNILLRIYGTLYNSPLEKLTEVELTNVSKGLLDLTQAGFKLEWLREKFDKVSLERKKLSDYKAQARELEKQLKNLEVMMSNLKAEIKLKAES